MTTNQVVGSRPPPSPGNRAPPSPANRPPALSRPPYSPGNRPPYSPGNRPAALSDASAYGGSQPDSEVNNSFETEANPARRARSMSPFKCLPAGNFDLEEFSQRTADLAMEVRCGADLPVGIVSQRSQRSLDEKKQGLTFTEAVMTMVINCVGAGVVLFPKIMADVGIVAAPILCIICALTCKECGVMICATCSIAEKAQNIQVSTYEALAAFSTPRLKPLVRISNNLAMVGYIIAYMQLVMESMLTFVPEESRNYLSVQRSIRFGFVTPLFCFIAMITNLKQLARFGNVGIIAVIIECGCIVVGGMQELAEGRPYYTFAPYSPDSKDRTFEEQLPYTIGDLGKYLAVFLFTFAILVTVPSVRSQLADPKEMPGVLKCSFIILVCINCFVMICGYIGFGIDAPENVIAGEGGIAEKLPFTGFAACIAVVVNILISSPIFLFCLMTTIEAGGTSALQTPLSLPNIGLRLFLVITFSLIGNVLPYVCEVIGIVSSVFACCNNILFPCAFHYCARKRIKQLPKSPKARFLKYCGILAIGACVMFVGFNGSLLSLQKKIELDALLSDGVVANATKIIPKHENGVEKALKWLRNRIPARTSS